MTSEEMVRRAVAAAPPLTDTQRAVIARLLPPVARRRVPQPERNAA